MALTTVPTYAAANRDTPESASLRDTLLQTAFVHDIAMPTFKILWKHRQKITIGPDKTIRGNMFHGLGDAWVSGGGSFNFPREVKDNLTQVAFDLARIGASTSISDEDRKDYSGSNSLYNLASGRVGETNGGMTHATNYLLWSAMGVKSPTEVSGGEIDLNTWMNNTPGVKVKGDVSDLTVRWGSIPQAIRDDTTTHTYGGISTSNAFWRARITDVTGATVNYKDDGNDQNNGIVKSITSPQTLTEKMITDALDELQIGDDYFLYLAMPSKLYSAIVRILKAQERGTPNNPISDLGINRAILHSSYNAVLYAEPALDNSNMWPNSIWIYDPRHLFLAVADGYGPIVYPWQRIGFSTDMGMAMYIRGQLVCTNRRALGAIHGVTA